MKLIQNTKSRPSRARGLKRWLEWLSWLFLLVAPLAGAWIETTFWKFIALSPWVMIGIMLFKWDNNNSVAIEKSVYDDGRKVQSNVVEIAHDYRLFAPMSFMQSRRHDVVAVWEDDKYWDNKITPYGIVMAITPSCIILRREDGGLTMLLDGKKPEEKFAKKGVDTKSSI